MPGAGASRQPSPWQPEVSEEQQLIHYSAAFESLSITRLLSQSHPGAFEPEMTRLALPPFPTPGALLPEAICGHKHPRGMSNSLFTQQTQKLPP